MDSDFIDILRQLVAEQTSATLTDAKRCKALLADYARNEYKKESRLLVLAVEVGVAKMINEADDLAACKKAQIRELEEHGLAPAVAAGVVSVLALVLRGDTTVMVSPPTEKVIVKPAAAVTAAAVEKPRIVISDQGSTFFTDPRDGQTYRTVKIGGLVWMAENLNYKTAGSWCYGNNELSGKKYGRLYTWDAAKAASPAEWRLPSREEWDTLVEAVGGKDVAGKKLKSKTGWKNAGNGTDEFGFSALPGGNRNSDGSFNYVGYYGYFWSATEGGTSYAYYRYMDDYLDNVGESDYYKSDGFSARYVEDT